MLIDARSLPQNTVIESDLCIIGAGTAGITLAREFMQTDFRVAIVESGGLLPDRETQSLYHGANVGLPYYPLKDARARFFGGSSHRWHVDLGGGALGTRLRPLDPLDFEKRDWVPYSGWPLSKDSLDLFYERAEEICRVTPAGFELADWGDPIDRPSLPLDDRQIQTCIYKFGTRDLFADTYPNEVASAENIATYLYANALEVHTKRDTSAVTHVHCGALHGNNFQVRSKIYVLSLGGLETPRLLLLSRSQHANGLGNANDLVGRFFMEHPHFWSGVYFPKGRRPFSRTHLYDRIHYVNQIPIVGKLVVCPDLQRQERLLNQNIQLIPQTASPGVCFAGSKSAGQGFINKAVRRLRRLSAKMLSPARPCFKLANMMEQVPNPESRVKLASDRDQFNQNRLILDWRVTEQDISSAKRTQEILRSAIHRAGLGSVCIQLQEGRVPDRIHGGYHHMGTTRMHENERLGVVDENSRVHGSSNLYIAGPSVFPTVGYANPVLTIVALTVRLADHVKEIMKRGAE